MENDHKTGHSYTTWSKNVFIIMLYLTWGLSFFKQSRINLVWAISKFRLKTGENKIKKYWNRKQVLHSKFFEVKLCF